MAKYSDAFMDWLVEVGYTHCFYVSGGNVMHLLESASHRFKCIPFVHEIGACIAVDYFNEISDQNNKAFLIVTAGPGLTNALTGIVGAWTESRELLIIGGQAKSSELSKGKFRQIGFQEIDGASLCKTVTKASVCLDSQISKMELFELVKLSKTDRKGPVFIEICLDVTTQDRNNLIDSNIKYQPNSVLNGFEIIESVNEISDLLLSAKRPIVLIGGGVNRNTDLTSLLNLGIPVATTFNGADRVGVDYEFYCGRPNWYGSRWSNILIQQADLIIALGTRLGIMQVGYNWKEFAPKAKIVQVEIDKSEINKGFPKIFKSYLIDCNEVIKLLSDKLIVSSDNLYSDWKAFIKTVRSELSSPDKANKTNEPFIESVKFIFDLMKITSGDEIIIPCSSGAAAYESAMRIILNKGNQKIVTSHAMASMGYGLSGAIGASLAYPEKRTITFEGDGGFAQNLQEIGTAVKNSLNLKIFIMDNGGYQSIKGNQKSSFSGHYVGCDSSTGLGLPDWEQLGRAYNCKTFTVTSNTAFNNEFTTLFNSSEIVIFIVKVDPDQTYWPRLLSKKDLDGNIISNPLHLMDPRLTTEQEDKYFRYLD